MDVWLQLTVRGERHVDLLGSPDTLKVAGFNWSSPTLPTAPSDAYPQPRKFRGPLWGPVHTGMLGAAFSLLDADTRWGRKP